MKKNYGDGVMQVSAEMFRKWANAQPEKVFANHGIVHKV